MSSIYNLEPQPTASVILKTTLGDLSVELFAKQTPLTSRNFLQHCLDGYYDDTIFHRLVPGFIVQGGDPTGSGSGGESIYDGGAYSGDLDPWPADQRRGANAGPHGINFRDEFHSRLKFNRRGLLGMANESKTDSNASQFFFTLDKADELNGRNTMFGRVVGDTIYNLSRIGESELVEGSERPLYPIKITGVEILVNPFDDMKKSETIARSLGPAGAAPAQLPKKKKKPKAAGKKLLSFGDDEGDADADLPVIKKAKFDTRIVREEDEGGEGEGGADKAEAKEKAKKPAKEKAGKADAAIPVRQAPAEAPAPERIPPPSPSPPRETRRSRREDTPPSREPSPPRPQKSALEQANEEIAALKASMRRTIYTEPEKAVEKSALEKLIPETSQRGRKRRRGGDNPMSNDDFSTFQAFRSKLGQAAADPGKEHGSAAGKEPEAGAAAAGGGAEGPGGREEDEEAALCDLHFIANCQSCSTWDAQDQEAAQESDDDGWMSHSLSFAADKLGKDLSYRKKAEEELVVIDPRQKSRTLQEEKKAGRDARTGATGREWDRARDQARNRKMTKEASTAGRGAR